MFDKVWFLDTAERTIRTFVQTWLGIMIASGAIDFSIEAAQAAAASAVASAGAILFAALSGLKGKGAGVVVDAVPAGEG